MAFQLKDDLLDSTHEKIEAGSFPSLIGMDETFEYLNDVTDNAVEVLVGAVSGQKLRLFDILQAVGATRIDVRGKARRVIDNRKL